MRKRYCDWMANEVKEYTRTGKIKRPSYETVVTWVKASWEDVDTVLIRKSFKCCGISVERDGTENELVFNYDHLNTSLNQTTIDAEVEGQTLREIQENIPLVNNRITVDEQIGDNYYDENELNYANLWDI